MSTERHQSERARNRSPIDGAHRRENTAPRSLDRRELLFEIAGGLGGVALAALLGGERKVARAASEALGPLDPRAPHHRARANAVIQIFCPGGMSHVDTWDHKPELERAHGTPFDTARGKDTFAGIAGTYARSYWPFRPHGECGRYLSDLFPRLAAHVDEIAFVHSMRSRSALHGPAMFQMSSGFARPGFPSMGSWITYGLGEESDELPAFVVLPDPRGLPPGGVLNWGAGFLPAVYQGTVLETDAKRAPIANLVPARSIPGETSAASEALLRSLNRSHAAERRGHSDLEARIEAYELAARLQLSAPEAVDLSSESKATHALYHLGEKDAGTFGRQCLLARRLVERGVRFVQIYCGAENTSSEPIRPNWDSHEDLLRDHGYWGRIFDIGASALLGDLRQRGLLDTTLVLATTEFGRQPFLQGKQKGRDHNPDAFTAWLAGGGIRGGVAYGATDPLGERAVENPTYSYDFHATALHLLGLDHRRLTWYHDGIERRLTDVHGRVIEELLA